MRQVHTIADMRETLAADRAAGKTIGFVPTMGALHDGHLALILAARAACDIVVVSIFVNPTQFDRKSDFETYPREEAHDVRVGSDAGVDYLFTPSAEDMYPNGYRTFVEVEDVTEVLCGAVRPGHFRGVATVIAKFLNIIQPNVAYFGEKDYQQLVVIKRMAADLDFGVVVVGIPTVREEGGLAISSRNSLLTQPEREAATVIWRALAMGKQMVAKNDVSPDELVNRVRRIIGEEPLVRLEYVNVVNPDTLHDVYGEIEGKALVAVACFIGSVRLIDNVLVERGA